MEKVDFLGKGWKFPVTLDNNNVAISEGDDLIKESILYILTTPKGERLMRPDFGCRLHELVFAPNNTTTATMVSFYVKEALLLWEPRIDVLNVTAKSDEGEGNQLLINIEFLVKETNTKRNIVYPFYLEGKK